MTGTNVGSVYMDLELQHKKFNNALNSVATKTQGKLSQVGRIIGKVFAVAGVVSFR